MYELVINFLKYISNEIYIVMLSKLIDFKYVFESFIFDQVNVLNNIFQFLKNEIMKFVNDGQYFFLFYFYVIVNVFKCLIVFIFF